MSEQQPSGFGQFIPGFDFLQNLAKDGAQAMPQMPGLSNWIAPTLNVEELDKRIGELRACLLYTSPSPRDKRQSRMPSSA